MMMHMDITEYVDALRRDLAQAARAMGPETEQAAERIGFALDSSARLALMDALSHAAAEITNELEGISVEDAGDTARIPVRLSEQLKGRAEELAAQRGQSLNTWIVGAVRAATTPGVTVNIGPQGPGAPGRNRSSNKRVQGWVR